MKIVFMGTPDFAVPSLLSLSENYNVAAVFTQPDRPKGRGHKVQFSPVKECACGMNIPVFQPERIKNNREVFETIRDLNPDLIIVVAYGQILPKEILELPRLGCINVHASLLPRLRGAAPINWAIIRGGDKTGVTTMMMAEGLDTGDMLLKEETGIRNDETAGELHDRLMEIGSGLLIKTIKGIEEGCIAPVKQNESEATYSPIMNKELGHIDWKRSSIEIYNLFRGVTPWPAAYFFNQGNMIKILRGRPEGETAGEPGEIIEVNKNGIRVACGSGSFIIEELQEIGGKKLKVSDYLNGHKIEKGTIVD